MSRDPYQIWYRAALVSAERVKQIRHAGDRPTALISYSSQRHHVTIFTIVGMILCNVVSK